MTPAILIIAFNRPNHTRKVFEAVRKARPERLYVAVDGPRIHKPGEELLVKQTLEVFDSIDWPCKFTQLIRDKNLGCRIGVSSAINWFFDNEEQGIILEDDCVPSPVFFDYCAHLLERFKNVDNIMHISGVNFQDGNLRGNASYFFSRISHVWGWATWRRAWKLYDIEMKDMAPMFEDNLLMSIVNYKIALNEWKDAYRRLNSGSVDTWDYQWAFSIWKNNGLCISPNYNFISNIGFDNQATHTTLHDSRVANMPVDTTLKNIIDEPIMVPNFDADRYSYKRLFSSEYTIRARIKRSIKKALHRPV